jgi:RNA polymerase sigma factor (sigma-70 family)
MDSARSGPPSTRDLVLSAQQGSREALEVLFRRHRGQLEGFIVLQMGPTLRGWVECQDIAAETFLLVTRDIGKFRWRGGGSFTRWLSRIAERAILRQAREQAKPANRATRDAGDSPAAGDSPSTDMRRWELLMKLKEAVGRLKSEHREVIILIYFRGLKTEQVARRMQRSVDAVYMLHLRALRKLRLYLPGSTGSLGLPDVDPGMWDDLEEPASLPR